MTDHHRMMIRFSLEHMRFLEEQLAEIDEQIRKKIHAAGYTKQWELLRSLPAVQENAAAVLAEMGPEPAQFPTEKHLASWSGLCPGDNRSAGRSKSSHTNPGNRWLRAALTESAWAVSRMKDGHLREKFWRIASRGEPQRSRPIAVVAIGHDLLKLAYFCFAARHALRGKAGFAHERGSETAPPSPYTSPGQTRHSPSPLQFLSWRHEMHTRDRSN